MYLDKDILSRFLSSTSFNKLLILELLSDNRSRTVREITAYLQRNPQTRGTIADKGRVVRKHLKVLETAELLECELTRGVEHWMSAGRLKELENLKVSKKNIPHLLAWEKMFEKYGSLPFFNDIQRFIEVQKKAIDYELDGQAPDTVFRIADFETTKRFQGDEHVADFYYSILDCLTISFKYKSFSGRLATVNQFMPYLLKEHNKRWYVVGKSNANGIFETYALDRVKKVLPDKNEIPFERASFDADAYWKDSIGIYTGWRDVNGVYQSEPIEISFEVKDGDVVTDGVYPITNIPYLKTAPIHTSQVLEEHKDGYAHISLTTYPNADLVRVLRALGQHNLRNIRPEFLSDWVLKG